MVYLILFLLIAIGALVIFISFSKGEKAEEAQLVLNKLYGNFKESFSTMLELTQATSALVQETIEVIQEQKPQPTEIEDNSGATTLDIKAEEPETKQSDFKDSDPKTQPSPPFEATKSISNDPEPQNLDNESNSNNNELKTATEGENKDRKNPELANNTSVPNCEINPTTKVNENNDSSKEED